MSTVTKGWRQLIKMINIWHGNSKWRTRNMRRVMDKRARKDKSVIDYVITDKKYFTTIKGMHID